MDKIAIIDYGMGNIHSVRKAIEVCGAQVIIADKAADLGSANKIILPGVGAFDDAMNELSKRNLTAAILSRIKAGRPFLGICLGMQLLFAHSEEGEGIKGLGVFDGIVKRFPQNADIKIPHIGWNQIKINSDNNGKRCPLLEGISNNAYVYFCHSYYPQPKDRQVIAATTNYGIDFPSLLCRDNVFGAQFHPEKSQKVGLRILKNFVEMQC